MSDLLEKINDLNDLILQGKALEAFDKYYHEDIVMQENDHPPVQGKAANRQREEDFFGAITEFRGAQPLKVTVDWGVRKYNQVTVQEWKDGQIISERFYYGS